MESQHPNRREIALGMFHVLSDDYLMCKIISLLLPQDIGKLACVSSIFNILCDEEPLWMQVCLETHEGLLDYKGTWKLTALAKLALAKDTKLLPKIPRQFPGFSSLFLYQRWYRCHVALEGFALDKGVVERRSSVLPEEFSAKYDGKKPVLLTDLLDDWPASKTWSLNQLIEKCGDAEFKATQPHGKAVPMKLKDFARYMDLQHDEEPLYIFDPQFGETVPELLDDYKVPTLFSDDLLSVLSDCERPPYRWLVLGPARSGASWHVDPSLTSAWNSLLSGRKRWALYPPGKVPPGVTLDIDEDDGSVHYDGPNSVQWWLDVYPHLDAADKPLECTQLPGETIYVPSGWWHCVLNIDASVAVTQNFVNVNNLEIVCMDLAPGYRHRAIARAGMIALEGRTVGQKPALEEADSHPENPVFTRKDRQSSPISINNEDVILANGVKRAGGITDKNLLLALDALTVRLEDRPPSAHKENSMEEKMRKWLRTLWVERPELQQIVWRGACLALDAGTWLQRINIISTACGFPPPEGEEQLPVVDGSNPVYFVGDHVIKLYTQDGPAAAIEVLGSELEFYTLLKESGSPFQDVVPQFVTSGILYPDGEDYKAVAWDGREDCPLVYSKESIVGRKRSRESEGLGKGRFRTRWAANNITSRKDKIDPSTQEATLWPYLVTKRCRGRTLSEVRMNMTENNVQSLATFLGRQLHLLHTLPLPAPELTAWDNDQSEESLGPDKLPEGNVRSRGFKEAKQDSKSPYTDEYSAQPRSEISPTPITTAITNRPQGAAPLEAQWEVLKPWDPFVSFLRNQRNSLFERFKEWGPLPNHLLEQLETYLPKDPVVLIGDIQVAKGVVDVSTAPVWLHKDLMMDNIVVEEAGVGTLDSEGSPSDCACHDQSNGLMVSKKGYSIQPRYIIDYGDIIHGDPLYDLVALHLDIFGLERSRLECFLNSYQLPLSNSPQTGMRHVSGPDGAESDRQYTLSYCAMCYCLLHEVNVMSKIFKLKPDIRAAESFEEIEQELWSTLNNYSPEIIPASSHTKEL
ncbi:unnamed protein product [Calypogeia fissa]